MLYGQAVPSLGGVLNGVLPQDAGRVSVVFTTTAAVLSPVGLYPIAATLAGNAAGNYIVAVTPASLSIAQAPTDHAIAFDRQSWRGVASHIHHACTEHHQRSVYGQCHAVGWNGNAGSGAAIGRGERDVHDQRFGAWPTSD